MFLISLPITTTVRMTNVYINAEMGLQDPKHSGKSICVAIVLQAKQLQQTSRKFGDFTQLVFE